MALVKCENCNHNYSNKAKKCPFCGNKPEKNVNISKVNKSKGNGKTRKKFGFGVNKPGKPKIILPILLAITIIIGVSVLLLSLYGDKTGKFFKHVDKGEYALAQQYVDTELSDDEAAKTKITNEMLQRIKDCEEKYISGEKNKEEALDELEKTSNITMVQTQALEAKNRVEELGVSRENYAAAAELEEASDYAGAMERYNLVIERDPEYQTARAKYEECFQNLKTNSIQQAEGLRLEQRYDEAMVTLEACQALKEDEEVGQALAGIQQEKQDYENQLAEQARIEQEQIAAQEQAERDARKEHLQKLIKVSRVSCDKPNSKGGVDLYVNFKNMSEKKIQSIVFYVVPVNAAGEALTCQKSKSSTFGAKLTGPFRKGEGLLDQNRYWENAWYNKSIKDVNLVKVEIEYSKGKKETILENEIGYILN